MSKDDHHLHLEEDFFFHDRKSHRKERKQMSAKDRSKYKKTDQKQLEKQKSAPEEVSHLKKGRVTSILAEGAYVSCEENIYLCSLKGLLKKEKTEKKNLLAVGDLVLFEPTSHDRGIISHIEPRYSILSRADNLHKNKEQLLAVNIDLLFIVASVIMPKLKPSLIDRYIIAAHQGGIRPVIIVNKIDLLSHPPEDLDPATVEEETALYKEFFSIYTKLDIPLLEVSAKNDEGLESIHALMQGNTCVFSGQSGVGKTTLLNHLLGLQLKTADVVTKTYKGAHTTTTAQLIPLAYSGFCIDTPGIKSFGLWKGDPKDLQYYFSEFTPLAPLCKYPGCRHLEEPNCAVKEAVQEGKVSAMRYDSYRDLMTLSEDDYR
ncbi:MAG: ribosome small subunit-dependent GTPase A [Chlamydiae bacterium]|nr:ribosome small subunit-dependent GTPase A [Chlamydiota bacterium]